MGNYEDWKTEYYSTEKVDLNKFFSKNELDMIKKLGIKVLDKIYTESEFEELYTNMLSFYDEKKEQLVNNLEDKITADEFEKLLKIFEQINKEYDF